MKVTNRIEKLERTINFNPWHDELGRFTHSPFGHMNIRPMKYNDTTRAWAFFNSIASKRDKAKLDPYGDNEIKIPKKLDKEVVNSINDMQHGLGKIQSNESYSPGTQVAAKAVYNGYSLRPDDINWLTKRKSAPSVSEEEKRDISAILTSNNTKLYIQQELKKKYKGEYDVIKFHGLPWQDEKNLY